MKREIGFIGLGRMGSNMVLNLLDKKYRVVVYNRSPEPIKKLAKKGSIPTFSPKELTSKIKSSQKIIWLMITAGKPTEEMIKKVIPYLKKGDIIIDGSNSFYKDSPKKYNLCKEKGISFFDCGVSGGIKGARNGACMMVGGNKQMFKKIEPLFKDLCVKEGYSHMGKEGSGHFVKGIHNGIEYGMMAALNEGLEAIESKKKEFGTDLKEVIKVYNNGSIIEGKLTNWLYNSFKKSNYLDNISCEVPNGETEKEMKNLSREYNLPILKQAIKQRVHSRKKGVCARFISAMRNEFGGHTFKKKN